MLDFIAQYWLEVLFGLITLGFGTATKYFYSLYKKEKANQTAIQQSEFRQEIKDMLETQYKASQKVQTETMEEVQRLKRGLLSIVEEQFQNNCKILLDSEEITFEQYKSISKDHSVYHDLGGNSKGDELFALVVDKYSENTKNGKHN